MAPLRRCSSYRSWMYALLAAAPLPAWAAGFQIAEQTGSGLGSVFSGQAALAEDASVVYYNPAGMALLRLPRQVVFAGHYLKPTQEFTDTGSCQPYVGLGVGTSACPTSLPGAFDALGHEAGGDGGEVSDPAFIPNLYGSWEVMRGQMWLGLGINAPFGLSIKRDPSWIGRFHSIDSISKSMNINPSIAWKANEMVSVGAGINIQHFEVELTNAISYRAVGLSLGAPDAAVPPGSEGVATVEGDDWGIGWNVGLMLSPIEILRIGLSYRSAIKYDLEGTARFANRPAALGPALPDGAIGAEVKLPDMWSAAIAWMPLPQLTVMADYTRTGWDSIQDLRIMRTDGPFAGTELSDVALRFQDSWRSGIGLIWKLDQQWSLRTGYARESSLVVDEFRTPRLPDAKRDWFGVGARYTPAPNWSLDFGLALVRGDDAPSNLPNQESAESLPRGSLVGSYQADATIVAAQLTWGF